MSDTVPVSELIEKYAPTDGTLEQAMAWLNTINVVGQTYAQSKIAELAKNGKSDNENLEALMKLTDTMANFQAKANEVMQPIAEKLIQEQQSKQAISNASKIMPAGAMSV